MGKYDLSDNQMKFIITAGNVNDSAKALNTGRLLLVFRRAKTRLIRRNTTRNSTRIEIRLRGFSRDSKISGVSLPDMINCLPLSSLLSILPPFLSLFLNLLKLFRYTTKTVIYQIFASMFEKITNTKIRKHIKIKQSKLRLSIIALF